MKLRSGLVFVLCLFIAEPAMSQGIHQEFKSTGFSITSPCEFGPNAELHNEAKNQNIPTFVAAFICTSDAGDPHEMALYSIDIFDESALIDKIPVQAGVVHSLGETIYFHQLGLSLNQMDIDFNEVTFQNLPAIDSRTSIDGISIRALVFIRDKKSYRLSVSSRTKTDARFSEFTASFRSLR